MAPEAAEGATAPTCAYGRPIPHEGHSFHACTGWERWDGTWRQGDRVEVTSRGGQGAVGVVVHAAGNQADVAFPGLEGSLRFGAWELARIED